VTFTVGVLVGFSGAAMLGVWIVSRVMIAYAPTLELLAKQLQREQTRERLASSYYPVHHSHSSPSSYRDS
jgi:hypothetical protein